MINTTKYEKNMNIAGALKIISLGNVIAFPVNQTIRLLSGLPMEDPIFSIPGIGNMISGIGYLLSSIIQDHYKNKIENANYANNHQSNIDAGVEYQEECRSQGKPFIRSELEEKLRNQKI